MGKTGNTFPEITQAVSGLNEEHFTGLVQQSNPAYVVLSISAAHLGQCFMYWNWVLKVLHNTYDHISTKKFSTELLSLR